MDIGPVVATLHLPDPATSATRRGGRSDRSPRRRCTRDRLALAVALAVGALLTAALLDDGVALNALLSDGGEDRRR